MDMRKTFSAAYQEIFACAVADASAGQLEEQTGQSFWQLGHAVDQGAVVTKHMAHTRFVCRMQLDAPHKNALGLQAVHHLASVVHEVVRIRHVDV
jgi:hypothetical protein